MAAPDTRASGTSATRAFALATAANTLGWTAHMTYMYYLAPIALREAGVLGRDALIFSLVAVAMGLAVLPAGRLADRMPRRRVLRGGLVLMAASYGGILVPGLVPVVLGTLASGVGLALLVVSFQSYVADLLDASQRSTAYGRSQALSVLASAIGPFLAALVFRATTTATVGLAVDAALFGAAALVGVALTFALPAARAPTATPESRGRWHHAARAAGPIAILYLFMGAGYGMTAPYFTVYFLDTVALSNESWGYLLAAGTAASAFGSVLAGRLGQRLAVQRVAAGGVGGLFLSSLVFVFPVPAFFLALGFVGRSFFATTIQPGMSATMMARALQGRRAETHAYGSLAWNVGWATGAAFGGILLARLGGGLFPVGGALALAGVATAIVLLRRPLEPHATA